MRITRKSDRSILLDIPSTQELGSSLVLYKCKLVTSGGKKKSDWLFELINEPFFPLMNKMKPSKRGVRVVYIVAVRLQCDAFVRVIPSPCLFSSLTD
jgi:hypothetical protein